MDVFPPGKSGGLIEAVPPYPVVTGAPRFRRVNPAASLKQADLSAFDMPITRFRRVNPAASLKLLGAAPSSAAVQRRFRRVNPAASLKHGSNQRLGAGG